MEQQNRFIRRAQSDQKHIDYAKRVSSNEQVERLRGYLKAVDELAEYMVGEGIMTLPVSYDRGLTGAHITMDGRVIATFERGFGPFKRHTTQQYHLKDVPEMLEFLAKRYSPKTQKRRVKHLDQVSRQDIIDLERFIDSTVGCNFHY